MQTLPLSPAYRSAIWFALALQIPIALVLVLLLDGGHLTRIGGYSMIAFWLGALAIVWRRPERPTLFDLAYVRMGYLPILGIAVLVSGIFKA